MAGRSLKVGGVKHLISERFRLDNLLRTMELGLSNEEAIGTDHKMLNPAIGVIAQTGHNVFAERVSRLLTDTLIRCNRRRAPTFRRI